MAVHAESNIQLNTIPAQTSLLGGHFVYFQGNTGSGGNTPASANVIADSRYLSIPAQWGYNTHIGANGIKLRYNEITLSEWKADRLTFYKPGTNNPSLELISGINTALNIYNPTNNTKTLGLDTSGLNFYGTSASAPDVTLNTDGLTLINGGIRGGIVGQDEFLYLSTQAFADEYEEYILSEDTEVDETKIYYIRSGEEGAYIYTEVSEPTGNPQENEYYEIAHAPGTIPIDNYVKDNWRQIIGRKFAVDTDGNLYANGLNANNAHLQQAEVEGAIVATSLTIGSGSDAYDGAAAINISGYDIEIEKNGIDEVEGVSVYLYPILYHNGVQVPTIEVDYSHFIWYQDDSTIGTAGDGNNGGRYLATYGHNYRVIYDFDDGAVGGGTEVVDRIVDPSKYITKISDTGITVHPEVWTNQSSYIQLDGSGLNLFDITGTSIAQYGNTIRVGKATENHLEIDNNGVSILNNTNSLANFGSTARIGLNNSSRFLMNSNSLEAYNNNNNKYFEITANSLKVGLNNSSRFLMNSDSLEAYDSNNNKYFEINSNNLSWGNNVAATTVDLASAARTATNYITYVNSTDGIKIHDDTASTSYTKINSNGMQIYKSGDEIASFGEDVRLGMNDEGNIYITSNSLALRYEQDRLFEASYGPGYTEFYFASSDLISDLMPALGCKYLNTEAEAIYTYISSSSCHADLTTHRILDSNNQPTGYTLGNGETLGSNTVYDVYDEDGDEISCGIYNGIMYSPSHGANYYEKNYLVTAKGERPGGVRLNACDGDGNFRFIGSKIYLDAERTLSIGHLGPNTTSTSTSTGVYLGWSDNRWRQLYSYSAVNTASDKKYKDVIGNIEYAKDLIMGLEPIEFKWKDSDHKRSHMGFIAQDAAKIGKKINKDLSFYEAHYKDGSNYYGEETNDDNLEWSMMYSELIAPLVRVVQEQQREIEELKLKIKE